MPTMTIGAKFFRNEARSYSNPATGFWRELIQNSIDNAGTIIDITVEHVSREIARVTFTDNGSGMSRDVLENVYFCLGETTKGSSDDIGGFGRARLLTCFAQESYAIVTQDIYVAGAGSHYEIEQNIPYFKGAKFTIDVHLPTLKCSSMSWQSERNGLDKLISALKSYLEKCQFANNIVIRINGDRFTEWAVKRAQRGSLSFGTVHVVNNSKQNGGSVYVRVRGVLMFQRGIYGSNAFVIVEVDPARSREVLVSNRDSLNDVYSDELDRFLQELSVNSMSTLKDKSEEEAITMVGEPRTLMMRTMGKKKPKDVDLLDLLDAIGQMDTGEGDAVNVGPSLASQRHKGVPSYGSGCNNSVTNHEEVDYEEDDNTVDTIVEGMVFRIKTNKPILREAGLKFRPQYLVAKGPGRKRRKLLAQWIVACEWAITALFNYTGDAQFKAWRPGFIIDPNCYAQHGVEDNSHLLLINPITADGKIAYGLNSMADHAKLLTLAIHEATHIVYDWHDEQFAGLMTRLTYLVMPHLTTIHQEMISCD